MSRIDEIQQLMEALGPASPAVSHVTQVEEDIWAVGLAEDSVVFLELDPDQDRLVLTSNVGKPRDSDREKLYEAMLGYNALWRDTGGVQMAVAAGDAMQTYALAAAGLQLDLLQATLEDFAGKARIWRTLMQNGLSQGGDVQRAPMAGVKV
jgi:hypothetical protein